MGNTIEEKQFQRALEDMQKLYTSSTSRVVILCNIPNSSVDGYTMNYSSYWNRGWCFFEFCITYDYDCLVNQENDAVRQLLTCVPRSPSAFKTAFKEKHFTCSG